MCENPKNHFVYDVGQNMVGAIKLKVKGKCGQSIKIRYGEMTHKDGCIYIKNLRSAAIPIFIHFADVIRRSLFPLSRHTVSEMWKSAVTVAIYQKI